jgi:hypothetical protein
MIGPDMRPPKAFCPLDVPTTGCKGYPDGRRHVVQGARNARPPRKMGLVGIVSGAGDGDGDTMGMTAQNRGLTGEQISALEMLAGCPDGCTEAVLKASGFTIGLLIRAGLATATPGIVEAGGRRSA